MALSNSKGAKTGSKDRLLNIKLQIGLQSLKLRGYYSDQTEKSANNKGFCDGTSTWRSAMLILTRRIGETLMVGDEVTVTVLGVKGNQVRIGVNAPKHVAVHREEIYQRIQREKDNPARAPGED